MQTSPSAYMRAGHFAPLNRKTPPDEGSTSSGRTENTPDGGASETLRFGRAADTETSSPIRLRANSVQRANVAPMAAALQQTL
jgi:hypothetical protein